MNRPPAQHADSSRPLPIAVLISGSGRSLENLAERIRAGRLNCEIVLVVSSTPRAGGINRARRFNLPVVVLDRNSFADDASFGRAVFEVVRRAGAEIVVMAGFLKFLPIPGEFAGRVINIHPALLPAFGGRGMYGERVHRAVLESGASESGCTVHVADNEYDHGPILLQKSCPVEPGDTVESLAARVFALELEALPEALALVARRGVAAHAPEVRR